MLIVLGDLVREGYGMSGHIAPISAWCAVDTNGRLLPNYCFADKAHVERSIPSGERWTAVRVVIDPQDAWEARDEARQAIDDLSDTVACAMLGGQIDEWTEDAG